MSQSHGPRRWAGFSPRHGYHRSTLANESASPVNTPTGAAYSTLLGEQASEGFVAFTFEQALDERIEQIEGGGTPRRPGALARVARIESDLLSAIASIRAGETR